MTQIKDTNVIKTPEVTVHPSFFLPDGVMDITVKDDDSEIRTPAEIIVDLDGNSLGGDGLDGEPDAGILFLDAPSWLKVVSQTLSVTPEGNTVVDVVLEVEDIPGATSYEVRLSK